jgi:propionate CoA-transferase
VTAGAQSSAKVMPAAMAVELVRSGMTLAVGGAGGVQEPDAIIEALANRFESNADPIGLTLLFPMRTGASEGRGTSRLAIEGMVSRLIGGSIWPIGAPDFVRAINQGAFEAYNLSIGLIYAMLEASAAGRPGVLTRAGLDTYLDPVHGGGALNARSTGGLVDSVTVDAERLLYYRAVPVDVSIIRGAVADEDGNIAVMGEPSVCGPLLLAQAARANKGKVIAQVGRIVPRFSLAPHHVRVPGHMVDAIVLHESQEQVAGSAFDPFLIEARSPDALTVPAPPEGARLAILRRCLLDLSSGETAVIGMGLPALLPGLAHAEGLLDRVTFSVEHGVVGGVNGISMGGSVFPVSYAPSAIIDAADQLRGYAGGVPDVAFLGVGEVDPEGNVNVSRFGDRIPGSGGFVDITSGLRRIVFCVEIGTRASRKFVAELQHRTFSAGEARRRDQQVTYITELGVLRLGPGGLEVCEYAPGTDPQHLAELARARVAETVRPMAAICFEGPRMNIRQIWDNKRTL